MRFSSPPDPARSRWACQTRRASRKSAARDTIALPYNDAAAVRAAFESHPDEIAAVIVEPYVGNMGLVMPQPGYLQALREICTQYKAVLIFDEVMTGFRVARGGVQERDRRHCPISRRSGKVIGGGLPVGAFGGRAEIMDYLTPDGPVFHAGTLSGNPLAMAAGIATLAHRSAATRPSTTGWKCSPRLLTERPARDLATSTAFPTTRRTRDRCSGRSFSKGRSSISRAR